MKLPDFAIIGAMKSGTSSLHRYLGQHPDVFTSEPKELDFFNKHYDRGIEWYSQRFVDGKIAGEASPNYMKAQLWPETAARMHRHVPDAKLICVLRNPIDRTLSHYLHGVCSGRQSKPFSRAVRPRGNLVMTSRCAWQLEHFLEHFPSEQIMLLTTEALDREPLEVLARVLTFLGLDPESARRIDTTRRHNVSARKISKARPLIPPDPALLVEDGSISLSPEARSSLGELFAPDVEKLKSLWPELRVWEPWRGARRPSSSCPPCSG